MRVVAAAFSDRRPLSMIRYLILFLLIACTVPAFAQSIGSQPDAKSAPQGAPQQTVIGDYLSLGIDGPRGHEFLFGYTGMPVYAYSRDKGAQPTCYDECAIRWPPYIVGAKDDLGPKAGVDGHKALGRKPTAHVQGRFISMQRTKRANRPRATKSTAFGSWSARRVSGQAERAAQRKRVQLTSMTCGQSEACPCSEEEQR